MTRTTCFWGREGIKMWPREKKKCCLLKRLWCCVFQNYPVTRLFIWSTETPLVMNVQLRRFLDSRKTPRRSESVATLPSANRGWQTRDPSHCSASSQALARLELKRAQRGQVKQTGGSPNDVCGLWPTRLTPKRVKVINQAKTSWVEYLNSLPLTHEHP